MRGASLVVVALGLAACSSDGGATSGADATDDAPPDTAVARDTNAESTADAPADATTETSETDAGAPLPALPLHTQSRWIVDAKGKRFKLASVNWYGAEEKDHVVAGLDLAPLAAIARQIRTMGFNSVRLPWSNEMLEENRVIDDARLAANPALMGKHALEILDAIIDALAHEGLVVVLDNHASRADWCCSDDDGNGLWYSTSYPESKWLADWKTIVARYAGKPNVVGADLRNELRSALDPTCAAASGCTTCGGCSTCACLAATWGGAAATDWKSAAERGGKAILETNPDLLIIVEGLHYATDLRGPYTDPVKLPVANRLVYSAHDYAWFHAKTTSYDAYKTEVGDAWGYLLTQDKSFTAPVWVGEFGTCHTSDACLNGNPGDAFVWFSSFVQYVGEADVDWSYWAMNGTEASGSTRTLGAEETFGVLDTTWSKPASPALLTALQKIQPATQGP